MRSSREIKEAIWKIIRDYDFKKKSENWYRTTDEVVQVINLQKSQYGNQYFLNFGVSLKQLNNLDYPKENQCHIRFRASSLGGDEVTDKITSIFDLENNLTDIERTKGIQKILTEKALPFIIELSSKKSILDALENGKLTEALVHREVKP